MKNGSQIKCSYCGAHPPNLKIMSEKTITICDGCGADNRSVQIVKSSPMIVGKLSLAGIHPTVPRRIQIDLCRKCDDGGRFICLRCRAVHAHEADCREDKNVA